jgi:hypothetical protein
MIQKINFTKCRKAVYLNKEFNVEAAQTVEQPNFETVWAGLQEVRQILKENAEQEKQRKESAEEWEKQRKKRAEEWEKQRKERAEEWEKQYRKIRRITEGNAKLIGKLGNRFGEMVEHMVKPNLVKKFRELGYVFTKAYQDATIEDKKNNIITEIDFTLENGDKVMIVEVKSKLTTDDITDHIERMKKVRTHADLHNDKRKYMGAIAGMIMSESEKIFALKNGFYVIEPSGETFTITAPEGSYSVREW